MGTFTGSPTSAADHRLNRAGFTRARLTWSSWELLPEANTQ